MAKDIVDKLNKLHEKHIGNAQGHIEVLEEHVTSLTEAYDNLQDEFKALESKLACIESLERLSGVEKGGHVNMLLAEGEILRELVIDFSLRAMGPIRRESIKLYNNGDSSAIRAMIDSLPMSPVQDNVFSRWRKLKDKQLESRCDLNSKANIEDNPG